MIGKLTGRIEYRAMDHVLLDVGGVGYIVYCTEPTLAALPTLGEAAALYTDLLVREDVLQLFGFLTSHERDWYRLLIGVQGIGAKAALAILGTLGAEGIARAITIGDWAAVRAAPGVGPKIAQRVVNELKGKAPATMALGGAAPTQASTTGGPAAVAPPPLSTDSVAQAEALSALTNLGYAPIDAAQAVAHALQDTPTADTPALIRAALRTLAPKE